MGHVLRGVLIPVITPFEEDGSVDEGTLRQLVDFYLQASVQGLFALGSSGQGPAMSAVERKHAAEIIIDQTASRTPVIVHVGTADTPTTIELAVHAAEKGAVAIGVIPPYYYCDAPDSAIITHFREVADAAQLPVYIYENPKYCGISISPQLGVRMKEEIPLIRGMKVAYGAGAMQDYVKLFPDDVSVFTGNADIFGLVPFGVAGMINPPTSFVPELCVELWQSLDRGDYGVAADLQREVNTVTQIVIANIKRHGRGTVAETFRMRGISVKRFPRWDTAPLPPEASAEMHRAFRDAGILE
jgi:dihydrodipicolinate synthase/N-acetylneuraminate lyase